MVTTGLRPLEVGLVLDLRFNEGAGLIAHDVSGERNHDVLGGGVATPTWISGGGLSFDGDNDYSTVTHSSSINLGNVGDEYTIAMRIKQRATKAYLSRVFRKATGPYPFDIRFSGDSPLLYLPLWDLTNNPSVSVILTLGQWAFVCFVVKREVTLMAYKDSDAPSTSVDTTVGDIRNAADLTIGGTAADYWSPIDLDWVRMWNRALLSEEISLLYTQRRRI